MKLEEQKEIFNDIDKECSDIMLSKGNDYANEDRLSNFKLVAQIVGLTPSQVISVFIATKTVRLGNLLQQSLTNNDFSPENESVKDSKLDLINYTKLLRMVEIEENKPKELF